MLLVYPNARVPWKVNKKWLKLINLGVMTQVNSKLIASSTLTNIVGEPLPQILRKWYASLNLELAYRGECTVLVRAKHKGPLRVQRPFYPESTGCAHIYLLHPPGGLVAGDELSIVINCQAQTRTLVTTPSAGKFYAVHNLKHSDTKTQQLQQVLITAKKDAYVEWLPLETIVFNGANAHIKTRIDIESGANFFAWDVVCLGRPAAGEVFTEGSCQQLLEIYVDSRPVFIERNVLVGDDDIMTATWGLAGHNSLGTLVANIILSRDDIDALLARLEELTGDSAQHFWSITQKKQLLIARYIGNNAATCRTGFVLIWEQIRPELMQATAVKPRIWNT